MNSTTPHPIARVRHEPTHRDPNLPPTMRVAVEVGYVQTCPDCRRIVQELAAGCISDPTVTGFKLVPGRKHAHEVTTGQSALVGLTTVASEPSQPISDTNGDDPDEVSAALFDESLEGTFLTAIAEPGRVNGLDPEGR
jgi:hypothetical protein